MSSILDLVKKDDSIKTLTDAIKAFEMDFNVEKRSLIAQKLNQPDSKVPTHSALVRTDSNKVIGIASVDYGVVQYQDAFNIADPLISNGAISILGGTVIGDGEAAYLMFKSDDVFSVGEQDSIECVFHLSSSHDGSGAIMLRLAPYRAKDKTLLPIGKPIKFKHSKHVEDKIDKAELALEHIKEEWHKFEDNVKNLVKVKMTDDEARNFFKSVIGEGEHTKTINVVERVFNIWKHGLGATLPATNGTLFGAVQAVAFWADREKTVRAAKYLDENSAAFQARLVGSGAAAKEKAYKNALGKMKSMGMFLKLKSSGPRLGTV